MMSDKLEAQRVLRRRARRVAIICVLVCILFFAGGGSVLMGQALRGAFVGWKKVAPPTGHPVALRLGEDGEVLLETAEGQLYELSRYSDPPWEAVEEPSGSSPYWAGCRPGENDYFVVPTPPGRVRQHVEGTCPGPEMATHYEVVLLDNHELWSWYHSSMGMVGEVYKGFIAVGGIGLSLLLGGLAYILSSISWRREE
jgi:hypothetical protein